MKSIIIASTFKPSRAAHVGVRLWITPDGEQVLVVNLDDHGIFSRSGLKIGMRVLAVNDVSCGRPAPWRRSTASWNGRRKGDDRGDRPRSTELDQSMPPDVTEASECSSSSGSRRGDSSYSSSFSSSLTLDSTFGFVGPFWDSTVGSEYMRARRTPRARPKSIGSITENAHTQLSPSNSRRPPGTLSFSLVGSCINNNCALNTFAKDPVEFWPRPKGPSGGGTERARRKAPRTNKCPPVVRYEPVPSQAQAAVHTEGGDRDVFEAARALH